MLLLLNLASAVAIGIVISLGTFGLFQLYFIAIGCMIYARAHSRVEHAGWSLGKWGWPINIAAMVYTAWVGTFTVFPSYLPITGDYMNYALPINVGVWIFALVAWFAWARKDWRGLNMEVLEAVLTDADRATKD